MSNSNSMVGHLWANQSKNSARSNNGNFHFEGRTIYSYSTPIAVLYDGFALVTSNRYSITTSRKHMPAVWQALKCKTFVVPSLGVYGQPPNHADNLKCYQEQFEAELKRWRNARYENRIHWASEAAAKIADAMHGYAQAFKLKGRAWHKPGADFHKTRETVVAFRAEREARLNTPERIAKRAKDQARREAKRAEQERLAALAEAEKAVAWQIGELDYYHTGYGRPALLRVKGDELQTSQGAGVPLDHAVKAFRFILAVKQRGEAWETNGHKLPVGPFQVDNIAANGDIRAGCHRIEWAEIERVAKQLNLI